MLGTLAGALAVAALAAAPAYADNGHFVTGGGNAAACTDTGTRFECAGKVAGLGGTTFEITATATGTAKVECVNPAGIRVKGQDTEVEVTATSARQQTPHNGQYTFALTSKPAAVPAVPACPNPLWTAKVLDVTFTTATLTLSVDNATAAETTVDVG
ncbi:hypothetical protein GCM10017786_34860 [Amycolatopsis deserti]|uniref:Secreted protein n=2 Tax=Amycolatopsis deserti TaxID=185696 RepID=A0ABQ3J0X1_9PSEU|nr:hypothetical protein GCM10017786_34860 [Amycolatopsis deserti]